METFSESFLNMVLFLVSFSLGFVVVPTGLYVVEREKEMRFILWFFVPLSVIIILSRGVEIIKPNFLDFPFIFGGILSGLMTFCVIIIIAYYLKNSQKIRKSILNFIEDRAGGGT